MPYQWTEADYEALKKAIAQGALRVQYQDKSVTYHSLAEMRAILLMMEKELGLKSSSGRLYGEFSKGTC